VTASTVTPWEDRLAELMAEFEKDLGKRALLEYGGLKARAVAAEIAEWRALAAQHVAEGVLRDGVKPVAWWRYSYIDEDGSHDLDMYYGEDPTKHYAPSAHQWNALYAAPVAVSAAPSGELERKLQDLAVFGVSDAEAVKLINAPAVSEAFIEFRERMGITTSIRLVDAIVKAQAAITATKE